MARVQLINVKKIYQGKVTAVHDFNLDIADKEFVVFVGPSGCGKSTTLRMVAGLEDISEGECYIDGELVNDLLPKDRHISMVFQNYALYPHLTVFENMAFPLRLDKTIRTIPWTEEEKKDLEAKIEKIEKEELPSRESKLAKAKKDFDSAQDENIKASLEKKVKAAEKAVEKVNKKIVNLRELIKKGHVVKGYTQDEIYEKVTEAAKVLDITRFLTRKPKALSGGQRQRVAIGRAMVKDCKVFLMDEPLSNLDAKLRNQMRAEIILLRKRINTTFIYVTHDQTEAMTLGDRIVCMRDGFIMQVGTPSELFDTPDNLFVAQFIGAPMMNTFKTHLEEKGGKYSVELFGVTIPVTGEKGQALKEKKVESQDILLGVRPEHMTLKVKQDKASIPVNVEVCEMMGSEIHVHVLTKDNTKIVVRMPTLNMTEEERAALVQGNEVYLSFESKAMHFFNPEDEKSLLAGPNAVNSKGPIVLPGSAPEEHHPSKEEELCGPEKSEEEALKEAEEAKEAPKAEEPAKEEAPVEEEKPAKKKAPAKKEEAPTEEVEDPKEEKKPAKKATKKEKEAE